MGIEALLVFAADPRAQSAVICMSAAGERISVDEERPESLKPPNTGPPALSTAAAVRQV